MNRKKEKVPEKDLKDINDSFKKEESDVISKKAGGELVSARKETVNPVGYELKDYSGKVLKHKKSVIPVGGTQITIGVKGQKFDDIPVDERNKVSWSDSDFEK